MKTLLLVLFLVATVGCVEQSEPAVEFESDPIGEMLDLPPIGQITQKPGETKAKNEIQQQILDEMARKGEFLPQIPDRGLIYVYDLLTQPREERKEFLKQVVEVEKGMAEDDGIEDPFIMWEHPRDLFDLYTREMERRGLERD